MPLNKETKPNQTKPSEFEEIAIKGPLHILQNSTELKPHHWMQINVILGYFLWEVSLVSRGFCQHSLRLTDKAP